MKTLKYGNSSLAAQQAKIEGQLLEKLESVLHVLFPNGASANGEFLIGDVHGKAGKSLNVCLKGEKRGVWHDFATGDSGQILDLIAAHYHLNLKSQLGLVLDKTKQLLADLAKYSKIDMPSVETKINQALKKVAEWDYLDADESYIWTIVRFDDAAGCKTIRPFNKVTNKWKSHPEPRPLFNLSGISKSQQIILVEGEKCAQALIDAGYCATTAMGGANTPAAKTDWSPSKDRSILIWPDNDEAGKKYAMNCALAALAAGATSCDVLVLPDEMPTGWDAADALLDGSMFDVEEFIKSGQRIPIAKPKTFELVAAFKAAGAPRTEHDIAVILSELFAEDWRYCAAWGQWYFWDGKRWVRDQILAFSYLTRQVCHAASTLFDDKPGIQAKLASAATASNIERLARADPAHAIKVEQWDADPLLLNTTGGIVDLRTGILGPHVRTRYLTKTATATPQGDCPLWCEFLKVITNDDPEFTAYLQRVIGYCLTGLTTEHALFFLYGTGANGKSVFLNVISAILGDYAKTAPMDTFMDTRSDRHPTDLAGLRGARFVCAIETEQGRRWNESKIKAITGGDIISARFMHKDFFEFLPQFKTVFAGNHKPTISNVDEAMSRRLHLIPLTVFIPPEKRDKHLTAKLLKERDGILAWAVQGLMKWLEMEGLHPPKIVTDATKEYLDAEDSVGLWLEDCCELDGTAFTSSKNLFNSWKLWAEESGEYVGSINKLSERLTTKNLTKDRVGQVRGFKGIKLKLGIGTWTSHSTDAESDVSDLENQL